MFGILILGDSISFGRGESPSIGWSGRLKKYFEPQDRFNCVYNLGILGDTSTKLLQRFDVELKSRVRYIYPGDKFIIMIAIGINDARHSTSKNITQTDKKRFNNNIIKLIKIAKKYTDNIVIVGITPVDESKIDLSEGVYFVNRAIQEYDKILKNSAKIKSVHYVNLFNDLKTPALSKLLYDGVHPNSKGYDEIYELIKTFLIQKKLIK